MLLDRFGNPDILNRHKQTPLMLAAIHGKFSCVERLIQAGANVLLFDALYGRTCLHYAAYYGHSDCLQLILSAANSTPVAQSWTLVGSKDLEIFLKFCLYTILYQPSSQSGGCPGLSNIQCQCVTRNDPLGYDKIRNRKTGMLNIIEALELPSRLVYTIYIAACADSHELVIKKGEELLKKNASGVPVILDHTGCNANEDINFQFTGFTLSGRVMGAVSGNSCSHKDNGPSNVNVELISGSGDVVSSVAFAFMLSAFINKSSASTTVGYFIFIIGFLTALVTTFRFPYNQDFSKTYQTMWSFFPPNLFAAGLNLLS
ncbi:hypothetical protein C2S53_000179 [Perilla frutescens var. hirtella]|uniref:Proteasome component Ecm29 N-terminal domain-containing protein n=1 Tax=Perilla frutescens var. hirtella TaxID=608512 RepID=A0AAD4NY33_PERFH|nr:hypothetical protein C2S53_000179 [Perilla frutescens var. hirtella]